MKEDDNLTAQAPIDYWDFFAREAKRGHSPLYERLAQGIRDSGELRALAALAKKGQPPANILFGAAHYLLLGGKDHALADHYPSVRPQAQPRGDAFPLFEDFCDAYERELVPLIETRVTNTNEVARSSALYPAFDFIARETGKDLHLIEIGPSAGFNLNWDRYRYSYVSDGRTVSERGPADSKLHLAPEWRGERAPPFAAQFPRVASRVGLELNPVDLRKVEDRLWLKALIWPEHRQRFGRLEGAMAEAQAYPQRIVAGDALALLDEVLRNLPEGGSAVVYHSHVTYQFSEAARRALNEVLVRQSRARPLYRVSIEWDGEFLKSHEGNYPVNIGLYDETAEPSKRTIAFCDPHGGWIEWRA